MGNRGEEGGKPEQMEALVGRMRRLEIDHGPDGWPAVRMRDISALCDAVEGAIPALDLLQARLRAGANIAEQRGRWWLFDKLGEGITSGETLRALLVNLIFTEC